MGNGYPVAALITRREIVDRFAETAEFFSTFGGNPPGAVASLTVLDVIDDEGLIERADRLGSELRTALEGLSASHEALGSIRGWGLMNGVEIVSPSDPERPDPALADRLINEMRDRGVLIGLTGRERNVLKIRPPLVIASAQIEIVIVALDRSLGTATGSS
jgi:4-aminobutyrate aminotransferase-like enzyme